MGEKIEYKTLRFSTGGFQKSLKFLGNTIVTYSKSNLNTGWIRIFGFGITWAHNGIDQRFSERIGKRKKIQVGDYRFGYLKP